MRFLLDTSCWLWAVSDPDRLNARAIELLREPANEVLFSAASAWELVIKMSQGKVKMPGNSPDAIAAALLDLGMIPLPVYHTHALLAASLTPSDADPFDRLLIAQASLGKIPLMTTDEGLLGYPIEIIWAGRSHPPGLAKEEPAVLAPPAPRRQSTFVD